MKKVDWELSVGTYPGFLIGVRSHTDYEAKVSAKA